MSPLGARHEIFHSPPEAIGSQDGTQELLIDSSQERTARRTEHLLVAARLSFFFFHGLLIISASLGFEEVSWWLIFTPAWLGDVVCLVLVILSWFGSCPCEDALLVVSLMAVDSSLALDLRVSGDALVDSVMGSSDRREGSECSLTVLTASHGSKKPGAGGSEFDWKSDVMGILSLIYMLLALVAELLLCRYLSELSHGFDAVPVAPAMRLYLTEKLHVCSEACKTRLSLHQFADPSSAGREDFVAMVRGRELSAAHREVLGCGRAGFQDLAGFFFFLFFFFFCFFWMLRFSASCSLPYVSCGAAAAYCAERRADSSDSGVGGVDISLKPTWGNRVPRVLKQLRCPVLAHSKVLASVLAAMVELSQSLALGIGDRHVGMAGIVAGTGICALALLHARMAVAESRFGAISDRLLIAEMRCGENVASLPSSVASVNLEVSGASLSAVL
ncbi:unnamed protein product [Symbiodinium microadriaticum]|nr:unnamed protein product [Symbiodinium microadriaticum]